MFNKFALYLRNKNSASLSRDYYIYAGFIMAIALLSSLWSGIKLYQSQNKALQDSLIAQSNIINHKLNDYFDYVSHIAEDKGYKIALKGGNDLENIVHIFKRSFFFPVTKNGLKDKSFRWPYFSWIDKKGQILVTSESGILKSPEKIVQDQYIYNSIADSWRLHLSDPIYDSKENQYFINAALGVSDIENEQYIGSIVTRFEVDKLLKVLKDNLKAGMQFIILNEQMQIIIQSDNQPIANKDFFVKKLINTSYDNKFSILDHQIDYRENSYKISEYSPNYNMTVITGYNSKLYNKQFLTTLIKQISQAFGAAFLLLAILFFQRQRIIKPINHLADIVKKIAKGNKNVQIRQYIKNQQKKIKYPIQIHKLREGILMTKIFMERERRSRKLAEKSKAKLVELNKILQQQNEAAKKAKKSREQFLYESRRNVVEEAIIKMTKDIGTILDSEEGNIIMTKQALISLHRRMLDRCSKILSYVCDDLNLSYVNLKQLISEAIEMNRHDADIYNVKLIANIKDKIEDIYIDQRSIKHVLTSLIIYAMEDRKLNISNCFVKITAKIITKEQKQFLQIKFEDNGHGISEEIRESFKENAEKEGKGNNTIALDLYAIRHVLALHKATLKINNIAGKGSIIIINIPYLTKKIIEEEERLTKMERQNQENGKVIRLFPKKNIAR